MRRLLLFHWMSLRRKLFVSHKKNLENVRIYFIVFNIMPTNIQEPHKRHPSETEEQWEDALNVSKV